ncbi:MAG: NAD(P)H-dependent oxidoreductase subunit E [Candidatus Izemoplasmatales bacterium]|jgi:NADH-quinone oxidoreductase subunit E|nr:NAD(P)H-dependent oxidoreductase subunit E [Candidatus Izemoplasmatales bacterium]MDD4987626.1 NAD(P)H-dependent oxidoreductase subunit E [Candidatus Izemoplasmatales bacterium]MDD5602327.1 NAD(P)H-dependent oxidoreductase subunit E [Candidatus Izemoplasmatales bacterium]
MQTETIVQRFPKADDYLIEILLAVQNNNPEHYLPEKDLHYIAEYLGIPDSRVSGVVDFYTFFSTKPRGKYIIQVCDNVPCRIRHSQVVINTLEKMLGIHFHETTSDGLFTLEPTSCLGHCDESPVIRINDDVYTNLDSEKVTKIIQKYQAREEKK